MKKIIILIMTLTTLLMTGCKSENGDTAQDIVTDTVPSLVIQIQKCARLYTTEYHIHKIVTHNDILKLKGNILRKDIDIKLPLGERKIAFPMDATLKAYIDFSSFSEKNIERDGQKITILLPDPKVELTSTKINQKEIKSYVGLVRAGFTDAELTNYEQQGREAIIQSIPRLGITEMARENAARTLVPMIQQMGYREEDITIAFRKEFKPYDVRKFLEFNGNER